MEKPLLCSSHKTAINWMIPARMTLIATMTSWPGRLFFNIGASHQAAIMPTMLNIMGAAAGKAKWPRQLIAAEPKASRHTVTIYGNIIVASVNSSFLSAGPGNSAATQKPSSTTSIMTSRKTASSAIALARSLEAFSKPLFSAVSVNTGTKADDNAPSPKSRRKRFGI